MSSYIGDLGIYLGQSGITSSGVGAKSNDIGLNMTDFLKLMLAQFQNQSIDDTADTSEMLNQMVQMQMIQAITNMTDASMMSYAASLVGKDVTIGIYDDKGMLQEIEGTVSATGTYNGEQVIFVGDTCYGLSQILAIGHLPNQNVENKPDAGEDASQTDPTQNL